ncbi:BAR domain-containing protein [Caenorhabditis elegans]|uniref:BAR domain-containing protein n=1 Tax=Caenorhabditis elegans TaxID=6239 RepID=Q23142_CAEEL|nr:BAR domain-containing protein [Caenorhabditis elegans]CCD71907.1 BAR domain-containing protein [Caenorhabditis elegans]|eukprot:NP_500542.1 Uncharacterized protein CELE_W03B1.3 [Caenorhabditis elegans]
MAKDSTKSTDESPIPQGGFYGLADHPNHGLIASILKRKRRKIKMTEDVKKMCGKVEAYKTCSDKLHQALLFMLVESPEISKDLVTHFKTEPNYRYAGKYLKTYEAIANKGRDKTKYESLEPAISTLSLLDAERESRVRKQLDNLKPLTKFIGEDYWEYARLRRVYWDGLEAYDDALTQQSKDRTEEAERITVNAQNWRNDCRQKLMDFIKNGIFDQRPKHCDAILKFRDEAILSHRAMSDPQQSAEALKTAVKPLK